jgi:Tol biopolymer transport system component
VYDVSPDEARIALPSQGLPEWPYQGDLFVMNLDGTGLTRLVDLPTEYCDGNFFDCEDIAAVAWSADGQRIAYSTHRTGRGCGVYSNIGIVNADGTGQQLLVEGGWSGLPDWAPDGQRIAFASGEPVCISPVDLEIMNADGTGRRVPVDGDVDGMVNTSPSWSPDGQSIVFSRFPLGESDASELFAVNVDGTGLRRVTGVPGGAVAPDWSPAAP